MKKLLLTLMMCCAALAGGQVVVIDETPVAEFTLPDGSTLKNAFVWRRSSEGLMIVHDDGQYFLNFSLLPADWKAAYLGAPSEPEQATEELVEIADPYLLEPTLKEVEVLTSAGRNHLLRKDGEPQNEEDALALATLQALLSGELEDARRFMLVIEEKGLEVEAVDVDALFVECATCDGEGRVSLACSACGGSGKCVKCDGAGQRKTGIGKSTIHCTTCRGKGECRACEGEGEKRQACRACRGRGKLLQKRYCEVKRDQLAHAANVIASRDASGSVTRLDVERIRRLLDETPGLSSGAAEFFVSERHDGSMDTNVLATCVVTALLSDQVDVAKRFHEMVAIHYPNEDVLDLNAYLRTCDTCEEIGRVFVDCRACAASGSCVRCGGDGQRDTDFEDRTIHCTTCRGTGDCVECGGDGARSVRCSRCEGHGLILEDDRARVKQRILVEALNAYFERGATR